MSNFRQFGSSVDRRAILRSGIGAGLALPFGIPALAAAQGDHDHAAGTPTDRSLSSDPQSPGTGDEAPTPVGEVDPFERYDPVLQPIETGPKDVSIVAEDRTVQISNDIAYAAWTFNGTVPGPIVHANVGDEINFSFSVDENASTAHSVDFHSAQGSPEEIYKTINPGEEFEYTFTPEYPGAYMYHCGTAPVLMHIGAGMYGAMIVRPEGGWPIDVSQELVFVQSDFYTMPSEDFSNITVPDYQRMFNGFPVDITAFNGHASQYVDEPIKVKAGEPLRIYVVNAGPNVYCTFHIVGAIFSAAYFNANPENKIVGQQGMTIGPGDGAAFEVTLKEPGVYLAVNHAFGHAAHGAIALLEAE